MPLNEESFKRDEQEKNVEVDDKSQLTEEAAERVWNNIERILDRIEKDVEESAKKLGVADLLQKPAKQESVVETLFAQMKKIV